MRNLKIKKTSKANQTSIKARGVCPNCKELNTGFVIDGDIPKYCRLCGTRMDYSIVSKPSSKKVEG